ncbi:MAG: LiaF-related protein [Ignavibacteriales bacterium]|nr:LiaF-related protein [Ignavibacteriales bacterium]
METPKFHGRVIIGILLILIGGLFFLRNYDLFDFPYEYLTWEYFFILLGILFFFLSRNRTAGIVFIAIGLFNLLPELWPLIFVMIGLYIIFGRERLRHNRFSIKSTFEGQSGQPASGNDYVDSVNIFGGGNKVIHSDNFRGGNITSIFGGSEINLANCKLAEGENFIEVTAVFGGTTIIVPHDWKVVLDVLPIFGGFGDKRSKDPNKAFQEGRTLVIKGLVVFGGGEVKTIF